MRRLLFVAVFLTSFARSSFAGLYVGAEIHPYNFILLPPGTGLSSTGNFGLGSLFAGIDAGGFFGLQVYLSQDQTGTVEGTGSILGQTGTFGGNFGLFAFGIEAKIAPPMMPVYLKLGIGLGSLSSGVTLVGTPVFTDLTCQFEAHGGLGLSFSLAALKIFAGIDGVYVKINSPTLPGLVFFRPNAGVSLGF